MGHSYYSESGDAWDYFPHDQTRSRAYRRGEDGLAGFPDEKQLLCFALALWKGKDPILKERLFGLTNNEGNHGEDVKEYYYYLDNANDTKKMGRRGSSALLPLVLLLCAGCITRPVNVAALPKPIAVRPELTQIRNFDVVDAEQNILRGGQPTAEQWVLLHKQGITTVLKLNKDSEGSDMPAELLGMTVVRIPISMKKELLGPVPIGEIKRFWQNGDGDRPALRNVYVHCEHGQDRTGLAVYCYQRQQGMSKQKAVDDMFSHGFHKMMHSGRGLGKEPQPVRQTMVARSRPNFEGKNRNLRNVDRTR